MDLKHKFRLLNEELIRKVLSYFIQKRAVKVWNTKSTVMGRKGNFLLLCYGSTFYIRHTSYLMKSKHAVTKCSTKRSTNNPRTQFRQKMIVPLVKVMILMETRTSKVTVKTKNDLKRQNGFDKR